MDQRSLDVAIVNLKKKYFKAIWKTSYFVRFNGPTDYLQLSTSEQSNQTDLKMQNRDG